MLKNYYFPCSKLLTMYYVFAGSKDGKSRGKERNAIQKYKNRHVVDVREGHNVTLECKGDGIPEPAIHWVILSLTFVHMTPICHNQNSITLYCDTLELLYAFIPIFDYEVKTMLV